MKNSKPEFISQPITSYNWLLWIGGLAVLYPAQLLLGELFVNGWLQIGKLIFGLLFLGFSVVCFYSIFGLKTYFFFKDRFIEKSFWGVKNQTIFFKDIESWTEIDKENKHVKWKDLTVYTKNNCLIFNSTFVSDYHRIRKEITKGKKRNIQEEKDWDRRNATYYSIGFALFGLALLSFGFHYYSEPPLQINYSDLKEIKDYVVNVEQKKSGRKSKSYWVKIKLQNYPEFDFKLIGIAYKATNIEGLITNVSKSEQVSIFILKNEYEMKISKTKIPDFWTRHFYDYNLDIYELNHNSTNYLVLSDYNFLKLQKYEKSDPFFLFLLGLGLIGSAIYIYFFE